MAILYNKSDDFFALDLFDNIQGLGLCFVTKNSEFIRMNKACMAMTGFKNHSFLEGKSYVDMLCSASDSFEAFISQDQEVLTRSEHLKILAVQQYADNWKIIFAEKMHIKNEDGEITGIFTILRDVQEKYFSDACLFLTQFDAASKDFKEKKQTNYILDTHTSHSKCSPREKEVIFYLIRGKTAKEIAIVLGLTYRTVERYIEAIKLKFNCSTKSQLIEKARNENYLNMLPIRRLNDVKAL